MPSPQDQTTAPAEDRCKSFDDIADELDRKDPGNLHSVWLRTLLPSGSSKEDAEPNPNWFAEWLERRERIIREGLERYQNRPAAPRKQQDDDE